MVESRDMAENVPITATPEDSLLAPLDGANSSLAKDQALEEMPSSIQDNDEVEKATPSVTMSSEEVKIADDVNQLCQEQDDGLSAHQEMTAELSTEQLKAEDTMNLLAEGEDSNHPECHSKLPDVFSEPQSIMENSVLERKEEEVEEVEQGRQHHYHSEDPTVPADSMEQLEINQEANSSPLVHHHSSSDVSPKQQESDNSSSRLDENEESGIVGDSHDQPPVSPEKPELANSPTQAMDNQENSQIDCADVSSSESPKGSLMDTYSSKEAGEGDSFGFPSNLSPSPASPTESENLHEDLKPDCQESTEDDSEERTASEQLSQPQKDEESENKQFLQTGSGNNHLEKEEEVAQDSACTSAAPSVALADPLPDADPYCQQRAAETGSSDTAAHAVPTQSPVATGIFGPAQQGLAAACDQEGLALCEPSGAGNNSEPQSEAGPEAVLESENKSEEATGDAGSEEATREQEGVKDLSQVGNLASNLPLLESPSAKTDPSETMVLASMEDPLEAREQADSQDMARAAIPTHDGPDPASAEQMLLDARDPAKGEEGLSAEESACTIPSSDEPSTMGSLDGPTNWTRNASGHPETPIEREIRLHLEREELLRRERGLASLRGTQEYVEVRIRPFLNQSGTLPKEKERQWAGAQMQREIQRECRREEDLVQLGKVRGAYDRGTPQELQEKKMMFEQHTSPEFLTPRKPACGTAEGTKGPSFAEASRATNMVILDSEVLLRPQQPPSGRASPTGNPFFCLRAKSPQSLLEQEVQEAQERERELQRQRYSLYGSVSPCQASETSEQGEKEVSTQAERPSCKKLEVTWPPPTSSETSHVNGLYQSEKSPRILRRQRSALIERWESGAVGNQEDED
nr:A-kinase anchor protein 2-like [Anolis sagrei ordinatus]